MDPADLATRRATYRLFVELGRAPAAARGRPLLVFGEADPIGLPASEATRAALARSQLRYEIIERYGPVPWFEAPDAVRSIPAAR